jgi:hypothetical protein
MGIFLEQSVELGNGKGLLGRKGFVHGDASFENLLDIITIK